MKGLFRAAALAAVLAGAGAAPALAQDPNSAPVMGWSQFTEQLDNQKLARFTGVSGGYVAFVLCNGNWFRVRASTSDVIAELQRRNYQPTCTGGDR